MPAEIVFEETRKPVLLQYIPSVPPANPNKFAVTTDSIGGVHRPVGSVNTDI
jgi:hypothetical protein